MTFQNVVSRDTMEFVGTAGASYALADCDAERGGVARRRGVEAWRRRHGAEGVARRHGVGGVARRQGRAEALTIAARVRAWRGTAGWYIITYGLGIYVLNLLIGILSPQSDPETEGPVRCA